MTRYLIGAAAAVLLSATPLVAADTTRPTNPPAGANAAGSDTSSGAKEQSSAPPGSPAESDLSTKSTTGASGDTSKGAKEQSSAPPGSAAATGQPNSANGETPSEETSPTGNLQTDEDSSAAKSAKMGKDEGVQTGAANQGGTAKSDTQKVDQPPRKNPTTGD